MELARVNKTTCFSVRTLNSMEVSGTPAT
uniref:Uncharacterized protein n=1 Tax=Arundo donax TaxID=35708 RepID=A0A0A9U195_ARUDO